MSVLEKRIDRSKIKLNIDRITNCRNKKEILVPVRNSDRLLVEPIWETQIDDVEGPLYSAYIAKHPGYKDVYVRKSIKTILLEASSLLSRNLNLVLRAGHRPLEVQYNLLASLVEQYKVKNPAATNKQALNFARTYVSDPTTLVPPHCAGAAVDVDIFDNSTGENLDFGCPVNTDSEIAFLHSTKITKEQKNNRMELLKAMLSVGFASHYNEWWHYSFGDQRWAAFYDETHSLYEIIEPKI